MSTFCVSLVNIKGGIKMKLTTREITMAALFAALAAVAAIIVRVGGPAIVPFSLVPFVVMLAGGILGARLGAISMFVYTIVGLIGLPVYASAPFGGPAYVFIPSFGFILGFIGAAYVIGLIINGKKNPSITRTVIAMVSGVAVIYIVGLPYMYLILNLYLGKAMSVANIIKIGFAPFILFDLAKAGLAVVVVKAVMARVPAVANN